MSGREILQTSLVSDTDTQEASTIRRTLTSQTGIGARPDTDEEEYLVEEILEERGEAGSKEFLVKWDGFDDADDNTWEPLQHVEDTAAYEKWLTRQAQ